MDLILCFGEGLVLYVILAREFGSRPIREVDADTEVSSLRKQLEKALEFLFVNIETINDMGLSTEYQGMLDALVKGKKLKKEFLERWNQNEG